MLDIKGKLLLLLDGVSNSKRLYKLNNSRVDVLLFKMYLLKIV